MEKSLVFTGKCTVLSRSYSPEQLLWRTLQLSLFEGLEQYLERYPKSGTMRSGVLYELQISEPLIGGPDGSALHSQKQSDSISQTSVTSIPPQCLTADGLLPTPTKSESERMSRFKQGGRPLMFMLMKGYLPTPTKNEAHNSRGTVSQWKREGSLNVEAAKMEGYTVETIGKDFRLNPRFVEEMMGFPIGWTELQP